MLKGQPQLALCLKTFCGLCGILNPDGDTLLDCLVLACWNVTAFYLACRLVKEGEHIVIVRLLHLLQEAAVPVDWFVTYQTLQDNSRQSGIFKITRSHYFFIPLSEKVNAQLISLLIKPENIGENTEWQLQIICTYTFDIKQHSGGLIRWWGHKKGHQVILLVHNGWLIDQKSSLIWSRESQSLERLQKHILITVGHRSFKSKIPSWAL